MMKGIYRLLFFIAHVLLLIPVAASGQANSNASAQITIKVLPTFNDSPLRLADQRYVNGMGDTLYVDLFRFYMTGIAFSGTLQAVRPSCRCRRGGEPVDDYRCARGGV
jgi:hypothetical protein